MLGTLVTTVHEACRAIDGGEVAAYIPELRRVDPQRFGVAICTTGGEIEAAGDQGELTLQSMCKPLLYAAALDALGMLRVLAQVGVEPTGHKFDSILRLDAGRHRPHNPMINAGAIATASLLVDHGLGVEVFEAYTGRPVRIDQTVLESERATAHTNRSLVHLLTHLGLVQDPAPALELYLQACSVIVTCRDLACIAATLANRGVNPITGVRALSEDHLSAVLTVMATCGMYDGSGAFAIDVGLPAKSGVSGGVIAVAPGRAGLAAFAPPLDAAGNSVRGVAAIRQMARGLDEDVFTPAREDVPLDDLICAIETVVERQRHGRGGAVASYAPEVRSEHPEHFAVSVCTTRGETLSHGDATVPFTIQAAANPFAYALALARHGVDGVHARVDCEPSGNRFDAIDLQPETGRPFNPFSNAGAIAIADLLGADDELGRFAGDALAVDTRVLAAEWRTGHRNLAIAHRLRGADVIGDVQSAVERYLSNCSLVVDSARLARMSAVLANCGVDPISGRAIVGADVARRVTAMMYACGMHDDTGVFAFEVGIPAKSGITGAIVAIVPGVAGIATYSPPVNRRGASVRGWATLRDLAGTLGLGLLDRTRSSSELRHPGGAA